MNKDEHGDDILSIQHVKNNPYKYDVDDDEGNDEDENTLITFVPKDTTEPTSASLAPDVTEPTEQKSPDVIEEPDLFEMTNEIPVSPVKVRHHHGHHGLKNSAVKSFRNSHKSGYHASTGPQDFFKKKYRSEILEVKFILNL